MGCFDFRCAISGLPILAGEPIRFLLLTESYDGDSKAHRACYMEDWWTPRTLPLKGKYNDYGGVEDLQEGLCRDIWVELLKRDVVEKGTGDNQIHDVPVNSDMDLDGFLEALWEDRLEVHGSGARPKIRTLEAKILREPDEWCPTIRRVTALLSDPSKYLVDDLEPGAVRVRCAGYNTEDHLSVLEALRPALQEHFVSVVTAGSVNYSHGKPELRVFAPPVREASIGSRGSSLPKTQKLSFAMIREDVWQALLQIPLLGWDQKPTNHTLEGFKKEYLDHYRELTETYKTIAELQAQAAELKAQGDAKSTELILEATRYLTRLGGYGEKIPRMVSRDVGSYGAFVKISTHWAEVAEKQLPVEVAQDFIDSAVEMAYVSDVLENLYYRWIPSTSAGQGSHFKDHENFFAAMLKVAEAASEERERRYGEY